MTLSLQPSLARSAREIADDYLEIAGQTPRVLCVILQNVQLNPEKTHPPLEQLGEFCAWKLSCFGLDLMLALVKSTTNGFSFGDSAKEHNPHAVSQFQLLFQICQNLRKNADWESVFAASEYLITRKITIDAEVFQIEVEKLLQRIDLGIFDADGNRHCLTMQEYQRMVSVSQA